MLLSKTFIFRFISILLIVILTLPILRGYFDIRDYMFLIGFSVVCIVLYPRAFLNKRTALITLFLLFLLLIFYNHEKYNLIFSLFEFFSIFAALAINNICFYKKDYKSLYIISLFSLIVLGITTLFTIPLLIENPDAVRDSVGYVIDDDIQSLKEAQKEGIMNYATVHSVPFILPILVYFIKRKGGNKKIKMLWLSITILLFFLIIKSSTTTPIILSFIGTILALIINENKQTSFIKFFILGLLATLIANSDLLISFLEAIEPIFAESAVGAKIEDFKKFIQVGQVGSQIGVRDDLHSLSWNTFFDKPLLGSSVLRDGGGHSFFVDKLAYLGLIGSLPLFLFMYFQFKYNYKLLNNKIKIHYLISLLLFVFLGFTKNIIGFEYWLYLFVILPGLTFYHLEDRKHILKHTN